MITAVWQAGWREDALADGMTALSDAARLGGTQYLRARDFSSATETIPSSLGLRAENIASRMGLEARPVHVRYGELESALRTMGPAVIRLQTPGDVRILLVVRRVGRRLEVIAQDLKRVRLRFSDLSASLAISADERVSDDIDAMLFAARIKPERRRVVAAAMLRERLAGRDLEGIWLLRPRADASLRTLATTARLTRRLYVLMGAHFLQLNLLIGGWWLLGSALLADRADDGRLVGWALLLFSMLPFRLLTTWSAGQLTIDASALLKSRLLVGALTADSVAIRRWGVGRLIGRVLECEAVESLTLSGGVMAVLALTDLLIASALLSAGPIAFVGPILLWLWVVAGAGVSRVYFRHARSWAGARVEMTEHLIEGIVGHRTRLAQESQGRWHEQEDRALQGYATNSTLLDLAALVQALAPRGWLLLGITGLAISVVRGGADQVELLLYIAGVLIAYRALRQLVGVSSALTTAAVAWAAVAPSMKASPDSDTGAVESIAPATHATREDNVSQDDCVLEAHSLTFRYRPGAEAVLKGCDLKIRRGDRVLLQGASGSGKSTLGALLSGVRQPESGLLLLRGLDRHTLGLQKWRHQVALVPQFHENHVFTGTVAFNLLMGRRWPPTEADLKEAEQICRDLQLGPLLARMPAGLQQLVGEMGWQLSHGERSRLFLARALLQNADVVILDESFAALDPDTLHHCLEAVMQRAPALVVIAHP